MIHECLHLVRTTTNMQHQARTTALFKINSGNRDRTNTFNGWSSVRQANRLTAAATCNHGNKNNKAKQQNQNQQCNNVKNNNATTSKKHQNKNTKDVNFFSSCLMRGTCCKMSTKKRRSCGASRVASPDTHVFSGGAGGRVFHECLQGRGDHLADLCGQFFRFDRREQAADLGCKLREKS